MKDLIKYLGREPLVHFLLIGAALFLGYDLGREQGSVAPNRILVSSAQVEQLAANFERTWMRPPTQDEQNALIENHVRDEVFYREALAMGLDRDDPLVRQRMRMKLEFILEDLSSQAVTDEALALFLQQNPDKFRREAQLSIEQIYLNPDKRGDLEQDAQSLLVSLKSGAAPRDLGDVTLVPFDYRRVTQREIARSFGESFAQAVVGLEPGDWTGPVQSAFGAHLVKVSERIDASQPELVDIRERVEREYLMQQRKEQKEAAYQKLREGYQVTVEPLQVAQAASVPLISSAQAAEVK